VDSSGAKGDWSYVRIKGDKGAEGERGSKWFYGTGEPEESSIDLSGAKIGDSYVDLNTSKIYHFKP
jgi:hypothetical protein